MFCVILFLMYIDKCLDCAIGDGSDDVNVTPVNSSRFRGIQDFVAEKTNKRRRRQKGNAFFFGSKHVKFTKYLWF